MKRDNNFIRYFKNPLYGISSSSSYRMPNSLVHLPVILMLPYFGIFICGPEAKPLLPLYFIIALYIGRDLVILSYKNYYVPVCLWIVFILFLTHKTEIADFLTFHSLQLSISITLTITVAFILYIIIFTRYLFK